MGPAPAGHTGRGLVAGSLCKELAIKGSTLNKSRLAEEHKALLKTMEAFRRMLDEEEERRAALRSLLRAGSELSGLWPAHWQSGLLPCLFLA